MRPAEFKARWNAPDLTRPSADALAGLSLPDAAAEFLAEAGLPAAAEPGFQFAFPGGRVPRLSDVPHAPRLPQEDLERYLRIGGSAVTHTCIDTQQQGRVVQVIDDEGGEVTVVFINSGIPQLAACLLAYRTIMGEALALEARATRNDIDNAVRRSGQPPAARAEFQRRLLENRDALRQARKTEEARARQHLDALGHQIRQIDPPAMDEEAFWAGSIEEMAIMGGVLLDD